MIRWDSLLKLEFCLKLCFYSCSHPPPKFVAISHSWVKAFTELPLCHMNDFWPYWSSKMKQAHSFLVCPLLYFYTFLLMSTCPWASGFEMPTMQLVRLNFLDLPYCRQTAILVVFVTNCDLRQMWANVVLFHFSTYTHNHSRKYLCTVC